MAFPEPEVEIDFEHLGRYLGDDVAVLSEVFGLFKHQVEMWSKLFDVKAGDEQWRSVMHSLKGSARAIGAKRLASLCEKAETMVGEMAIESHRGRILEDIQFRIDRINIEIGRWEYRQTLASMRS
ncbi:MAG TPA: hypothetical protein ENJ42_03710 [Hellea balneolensis]|uniref:HPt domain-containing protein n=1 Tax=Hellea balneolensis TaxID=287478 RepID=A0A7C5QRE9_9PROT|nr:hypothetical protein [Hellea balneolensis]